MLCFSKDILGSNKHLLFDNESNKIAWVSEEPEKIHNFGFKNSKWSAEALFETLNRDIPNIIGEEWTKMMGQLKPKSKVPWPFIIPTDILKESMRLVAQETFECIEALGEYVNVIAASRDILASLESVYVDEAKYDILYKKLGDVMLQFKPNDMRQLDPPIYSHKSATGRLIIKERQNILSAPKEIRQIFDTKWASGKNYQIDFVSLEPRILRLISTGGFAPNDIYVDLQNHFKNESRSEIKLRVMKSVYGQSQDASGLFDYFGLSKIHEFMQNEKKSWWGRPLLEAFDRKHEVSHWTQSTAVDVALQGFGKLIKKLRSADVQFSPHHVLVDALFIDLETSKDNFQKFSEIVHDGIYIENMGKFNFSLSELYETQ